MDQGERHGYPAVKLRWYESELIRRTDPQQRTIGRYFAEEIAAPLGLDLYIGLPDDVPEKRLARIMGDWYRVKMVFHMRTMPRRFVTNFLNPRSITARSFANPKVVGEALRYNDREIRRLELEWSSSPFTCWVHSCARAQAAREDLRPGGGVRFDRWGRWPRPWRDSTATRPRSGRLTRMAVAGNYGGESLLAPDCGDRARV